MADPLPQVYICKIVILPPPLRGRIEVGGLNLPDNKGFGLLRRKLAPRNDKKFRSLLPVPCFLKICEALLNLIT